MSGDYPLPDTAFEPTREFWAAASRGELRIPRCQDCRAYNWYPPRACTACGGERLRYTEVSGRARLFSWAVVRRGLAKPFAGKVPYITALVSLEEDPAVRLVTNLVDCEPDELRAGQSLRVVYRPLAFPGLDREVVAPLFTPVRDEPEAPAEDSRV